MTAALTDARQRLVRVGSERRAPVLIEEMEKADIDDARDLLRDYFSVCEALAPFTGDLRDQFQRVGYVSDNDDTLEFPLTVYRAAYEDDDITQSLSWTTEMKVAEFFARHHTSIRAAFLGLYRDDVDMLIWQGTCVSALGYFTGRGESEVVPDEIVDIHAIAKLERVKG